MRIVFVTRSLEYGGAERQLSALAAGLARRGHDVAVLSLYDRIPLAAGLAEAGCRVQIVGKKGRWDVLGFVARIIRALRELEPDVVHSYMPGANLICAMLKPLVRNVALVWGVRSSDVDLKEFEWLTRLVYRVEPMVSAIPDRIIINSRAGLEHAIAQGYPAERISVIPNGVDVRRFQRNPGGRRLLREEWGVGEEMRLIGLVGRLDPFKDHATFLRAAARIAAVRKDVRFVCVGDDPKGLRPGLESLVEHLGLPQKVRFEGAREDIAAVYSALDLLCSSSTTEGFPNVVAEAMACGTPCVVTDAGDSALIVGSIGRVAPREDAETLARAALEMLASPPSSVAVRERILTEFSLEALVSRTESVLNQAVAR
ncbi:MAG TPA: glycosyltransferase [Thermoanaerobaculia bacterium]|nr:glycosyltransferase [Thermoanaerobaculia bacterium]